MKKRIITLLSVILTAVIIWIAVPHISGAGSNDETLLIGDVDEDNSVTIVDATAVQRRLAGLKTLTELQEFLGDTDGDENLTIIDATLIQRKLADLGNEFWRTSVKPGTPSVNSVSMLAFYPEYKYGESAYAKASVRLSFSGKTYRIIGRTFETRYEVFVNGEKVADDLSERYYDCAFDTPGEYTVTVVPRNVFGEGSSSTQQFQIIDSPERPYIADAEYNEAEQTLRVKAAGGAGGYRYKYYIRYFVPAEPTECPTEAPTEPPTDAPTVKPTEKPTAPPFNYDLMPDKTYQLVSDYIGANKIRIPDQMLQTDLEYIFFVSTIDRNNVESELSRVYLIKY